jgi:hypothetical protein
MAILKNGGKGKGWQSLLQMVGNVLESMKDTFKHVAYKLRS